MSALRSTQLAHEPTTPSENLGGRTQPGQESRAGLCRGPLALRKQHPKPPACPQQGWDATGSAGGLPSPGGPGTASHAGMPPALSAKQGQSHNPCPLALSCANPRLSHICHARIAAPAPNEASINEAALDLHQKFACLARLPCTGFMEGNLILVGQHS